MHCPLQQTPFAEADDEAGFFGDRNELYRRNILVADSAAHERFHGFNLPGYMDDRLVVEAESAILQGSMQAAFDRELFACQTDPESPWNQLFAGTDNAISTPCLGLEHGVVSPLQQCQRIFVRFVDCDADTCGRAQGQAADDNRLLDRSGDLAGKLLRLDAVKFRHQEDKFVAADS